MLSGLPIALQDPLGTSTSMPQASKLSKHQHSLHKGLSAVPGMTILEPEAFKSGPAHTCSTSPLRTDAVWTCTASAGASLAPELISSRAVLGISCAKVRRSAAAAHYQLGHGNRRHCLP